MLHGSGIVTITARGRSIPFMTMNSSVLSSMGRVGTALVDDGQHLVSCHFSDSLESNGLLTGQHGIHVAADGIDLAVMQNKTVGVGTVPAGGRVGGEAAVHHADGGLRNPRSCRSTIEQDAAALTRNMPLYTMVRLERLHYVGIRAGLLKHAAHYIQAAVKGDAGLSRSGRLSHKALP